jgi:Lon protease-like protein
VATLLPLFPLDVVLFPGMEMPLHIFEPRYKEMIGECLEEKKQFGVVRVRENALAEIGCTAEITALVKKYDDGRMDIATIGRRRFEIVEVKSERIFLQADVLFVDDEPSTPSPENIARALELHAQVVGALGEEADAEADSPQLSYDMAGALPIDLEFKQTLLGVRSEAERLEGLIEFYEAILPKLEKGARRRQKAGGNGHVP